MKNTSIFFAEYFSIAISHTIICMNQIESVAKILYEQNGKNKKKQKIKYIGTIARSFGHIHGSSIPLVVM